jgi:hypothetical protein
VWNNPLSGNLALLGRDAIHQARQQLLAAAMENHTEDVVAYTKVKKAKKAKKARKLRASIEKPMVQR